MVLPDPCTPCKRRPHAARSRTERDLWVQRIQGPNGSSQGCPVCPVPPGQQAQWDLRACRTDRAWHQTSGHSLHDRATLGATGTTGSLGACLAGACRSHWRYGSCRELRGLPVHWCYGCYRAQAAGVTGATGAPPAPRGLAALRAPPETSGTCRAAAGVTEPRDLRAAKGCQGIQKDDWPTGVTGPTGTSAISSAMSALNISASTISVTTDGTIIPLPVQPYMDGFVVNAPNTEFTVAQTGTYLISMISK